MENTENSDPFKIVTVCRQNESRSQLMEEYLKKYLGEIDPDRSYQITSGGTRRTGPGYMSLILRAVQKGKSLIPEIADLDPSILDSPLAKYVTDQVRSETTGLDDICLEENRAKPLTEQMVDEANLVITISDENSDEVVKKYGDQYAPKVYAAGKLVTLDPQVEYDLATEGGGINKSWDLHVDLTTRVRDVSRKLAYEIKDHVYDDLKT